MCVTKTLVEQKNNNPQLMIAEDYFIIGKICQEVNLDTIRKENITLTFIKVSGLIEETS